MPGRSGAIRMFDRGGYLPAGFSLLVDVIEQVVGNPSHGLPVGTKEDCSSIVWTSGLVNKLQHLAYLQLSDPGGDALRSNFVDVTRS